nr:hypothetical protein [Candidatus Krumholzibacteria bacterium]
MFSISGNTHRALGFVYLLHLLLTGTSVSLGQVLIPPEQAAVVPTESLTFGVAVSGQMALTCEHFAGISVLDITNPNLPQPIGQLDTPGQARNAVIAGDLAYVADRNSGLRIIDLSSPPTLTELGTVDTPGLALGVAVSGDLVLVADKGFGLQVIDTSDPSLPSIIGAVDTPGLASDVVVQEGFAYVADFDGGLVVIDLASATQPTVAGSFLTAGEANGLDVHGDLCAVAALEGGLILLDISTPGTPTLLATVPTGGAAYEAIFHDDLVVVATAEGLEIISVVVPTDPAVITTYQTVGPAFQLARSGRHLAVACGGSGWELVTFLEEPTAALDLPAPGRLRAAPNPFNPRTVLDFSLPEASWGELAVFDLSGRRVDTLRQGLFPAGDQSFHWTPTGLSSGVYLARLTTPFLTMTRRLTLVR